MKTWVGWLASVGWLLLGAATGWAQLRMEVVSIRHVSCPGGRNGLVIVQAAEGQSPYEYALDNRGFRFGNRFEDLAAGNYRIQARDRQGLTGEIYVEVLQPEPLRFESLTLGQPTRCSAPGDGHAVVRAGGGTSPYEYRLAGSGIRFDGRFEGLLPGTYRLTIIDRRDCTRDTVFSLDEPLGRRSLRFEATPARCADTEDGRIHIGGDTSGLRFSLDGLDYAARTDWPGLAGRRGWLVFSTDTTGCLRTDNVFVGAPAPLTARLLGRAPARCGATGGVLRFEAAGGTPPYRFLLTTGSDTLSNTGGRFADLPASTYDLIVRDAQGCETLLIVDLGEQADLGLELAIEQPLCLQARTGRIGGRATSGQVPLRYRLNAGPWQDSLSFENLDRGLYRLTARDATGCEQDTLIELAYQNQLRLRIDEQPPTCTEEAIYSDGQLRIHASGGTAPYAYALNGGPFGPDSVFTDLINGAYFINVRDAAGCQTDAVVFLFPYRQLRIDYAVSAVGCAGDSTGAVRVRVRGGNAGHWFGLHPRALNEGDSVYTGLPAGPFVVYVMDPFGCIDRDTVEVSSPEPIRLQAHVTGTSCPGRSDGMARLAATGGTGIVRLLWLDTGDTLQLPDEAAGLAAGLYDLILTDSAGCIARESLRIDEPSLRLGVLPSVCGGAEGRIALRDVGLRPPVSYRLVGETDSSSQSEALFIDLPRGTYRAEALGAEACTLRAQARITGPEPLGLAVQALSPSSCRTNDGLLAVAGTGGRRPYAYGIEEMGLQSDSIFAFLSPGTYRVRLQDSAGCIARTAATIFQPEARFRLTILTQDVSCAGGADGLARVEVREGLPPYRYLWATGDEGPELSRQPAGTYAVAVEDQTGCLRRDTARIGEPPPLELDVRIDTLERAYRISALASGGSLPYRFSLNDSLPQTDPVYSPLGAGAYVLTVIDANACTRERAFELAPLKVGRRPADGLSASVYPNPTAGRVRVRTNRSGPLDFQVFDALGRPVLAGQWSDGRLAELDLVDWPAGIYLLRVGRGAEAASLRLLRVGR